MSQFRDVKQNVEGRLGKLEPRRDDIRARIVSVGGSVKVPGRTMHVWTITLDGKIDAVFNPNVQVRENMDVILGYDGGGRFEIVKPDWRSPYVTELDSALLPNHGDEHAYRPGDPGPDVTDLHSRALVDLRVVPTTPASMRVRVVPGDYRHKKALLRFSGGYSADFTAQIPAGIGRAKLAVVCVSGSTNVLAYVYGSEFPDNPAVAPPASARPSISNVYAVLSAVRLYNGQTEIVEDDFGNEIRPLLRTGAAGASDVDTLIWIGW